MSHQQVRFFFCVIFGLGIIFNSLPNPNRYVRFPQPLTQQLFSIAAYDAHLEGRVIAPQRVPYIDPEFATLIEQLQPTIIKSARRHNNPLLSPFSDEEFAFIMTAQLYFEYNAVLEARSTQGRTWTQWYQQAQEVANQTGLSNFSIWPANLRPSVGLSLLRGEMPYIDHYDQPKALAIPITIYGSDLDQAMQRYPDWYPSLNAVTTEINNPHLAVEYLAANFEVALYRAHYDWVPVSWTTLVAWHNRGIVDPELIERDHQLAAVIPAVARYFPLAIELHHIKRLSETQHKGCIQTMAWNTSKPGCWWRGTHGWVDLSPPAVRGISGEVLRTSPEPSPRQDSRVANNK